MNPPVQPPKIGPARCSCRADLEPGALACRACGLLVSVPKKPVRGIRPASRAAFLLGVSSGMFSVSPVLLSATLYLVDSPETAAAALNAFWVCAPISAVLMGVAAVAARRQWLAHNRPDPMTRPASLEELLDFTPDHDQDAPTMPAPLQPPGKRR